MQIADRCDAKLMHMHHLPTTPGKDCYHSGPALRADVALCSYMGTKLAMHICLRLVGHNHIAHLVVGTDLLQVHLLILQKHNCKLGAVLMHFVLLTTYSPHHSSETEEIHA